VVDEARDFGWFVNDEHDVALCPRHMQQAAEAALKKPSQQTGARE
jgi:hypothetical protein